MNGPPRQAERVIRPCRAGTAKVRPADLGRMNRQRGRVPPAEHHETHPANLSGQKDLALHQRRRQVFLPGKGRGRISQKQNR